MKDNSDEIFPIVDENGNVVDKATRGRCHDGSKLLHPVVHLHVFNSEGAIFLQKRPMWKDIQPGKWDTAVGGHVDFGEDTEEALRRETWEELGIKGFVPTFVESYVFENDREKEYVNVYSALYGGEIRPSEELAGGRFWSIEELKAAFGKGVFTPNFEQEFSRLASNPLFPVS